MDLETTLHLLIWGDPKMGGTPFFSKIDYWLVVSPPLKNMSSSVGMIILII